VDDDIVKDYFNDIATEFDNIYDNEGTLLTKFMNKIFRASLYERVNLTVQECDQIQNKTILDIGCGSGRVSFLLNKAGGKITGIDYSNNMIALAKKYQTKFDVNSNIEFRCCDFMKEFPDQPKFDISIALGVFDYIQNSHSFINKAKNITKNLFIASFPTKYNFQTPLRKIWLKKRNCPVYFYTKNDVEKAFSGIGFKQIKIIGVPQKSKLPIDFLVIAKIN